MTSDVNKIHSDMLENISNDYQKTQGFPTYDLTRAFAITCLALYVKAQDIENKLDVNNLSGNDLTRFIEQRRNVKRKAATFAIGFVRIVEGSGFVNTGDLFESDGGVQFESVESKAVNSSDTVMVKCVVAGNIGNVGANTIVNMPITIQGIATITNDDPTKDGYDAESDDDFRERYLESLREPIVSGNIYHYKAWAKEVEGVGDAKIFPLWTGDNTVKVVVIDSNRVVPSDEIIKNVQNHIDPGITGRGEGAAPTGAYCTVQAAEPLVINVITAVTLKSGYDLPTVTVEITETVTEYLKTIAFKQDYVSYAMIADAVLSAQGVIDYTDVLLNGGKDRVAIDGEQVAVLGQVVVSES